MSDRVKWIEYKGYTISYRDFSSLEGEPYFQAMDEAVEQLKDLTPGSMILTLTDVSNTHVTRELQAKQRELETACNRFQPIHAAVGLTGIMKIIAKAFKSTIFFANSIEEAKEYLISEAKKAEQKQPVA